jgi:DNA-binding PadR family transcriptional regulator
MSIGGFVRLHVLYHAVRESVFGEEMMEELARHGYDVGHGTLYPLVHQLEEAGYPTVQNETVGGKHRKYSRATHEGAKALADAEAKLRELVKEGLHDAPTPSHKSKSCGMGAGNDEHKPR